MTQSETSENTWHFREQGVEIATQLTSLHSMCLNFSFQSLIIVSVTCYFVTQLEISVQIRSNSSRTMEWCPWVTVIQSLTISWPAHLPPILEKKQVALREFEY